MKHKARQKAAGTKKRFKRKMVFNRQVYYAHWVEFGHKLPGGGHFAGKPFLRPAFDKNKNKVVLVMRREMARGIKRYRKG